MLRFREFQAVRGTDCLAKQGCLRSVVPPSVSIFFSYHSKLTAAPRGMSGGGNMAQARTGAACGGMLYGVTLLFRWSGQSDASSGAGANIAFLVQFYGHAAAKPSAMQAAAHEVKGAEGVSRYKLAGKIPTRCRFRAAGWRSKRTYRVKTMASVAIFCDPVFAEVCTGKRLNRPDNRRFFQVVKRGAVNDSIGQGGDYTSAAGAERKNCFCVKKVFVSLHCRASLAFSRSSDGKAIRRSGERI